MTFTPTRTPPAEPPAEQEASLPNLAGDIEVMLDTVPAFRWKRHGYNVDEVDNYIALLLDELRAARQSAQSLLDSLLDATRQVAVQQQELATLRAQQTAVAKAAEQAPDWLPQRMQTILRLAGEEAAGIRAEAEADGARIRERALAEARTEIGRLERQATQRLALIKAEAAAQLQLRNQAVQTVQNLLQRLDAAQQASADAFEQSPPPEQAAS